MNQITLDKADILSRTDMAKTTAMYIRDRANMLKETLEEEIERFYTVKKISPPAEIDKLIEDVIINLKEISTNLQDSINISNDCLDYLQEIWDRI